MCSVDPVDTSTISSPSSIFKNPCEIIHMPKSNYHAVISYNKAASYVPSSSPKQAHC